ncbi:ribosomal protein L1p/L10e family-domain-containing protein [Panaeolus papilionaceus]|nr:ribosomal protein L1p/L10e family-domain-containing protein [Panaeolus papilionaceus]
MSKGDVLIDSHVSLNQCKKAVEALHSHQTKKKEKFEENQILPAKEQHVWLNVTVKKLSPEHKLKPVKIPIVHPLVDPRTESVCLITKDPQRQYKDLLEAHSIKFISRVVGLEKLKGKFKPYDARRALLKENGLFLADERVIPLLPKLLGSKWFEAKKQPIPVCLTRKDLKGELERAISATYMNQNRGTCTAIKVGKLSHTASQIIDNIKAALPAIAKAVRGGWENIQSLHIKTNSSVSLPIWTCSLDDSEGGRWNGLQLEEGEEMDIIEESEEEVEDQKAAKASVKGKKRPTSSDDEEEEEEKPRKKAKSVVSKETSTDSSKASKSKTTVDATPSTQPKKSKGDAVPTSTSKPSSDKEDPQSKKSKKQKDSASVVVDSVPPVESQKKKKGTKAAPSLSMPVVEAPSKKSKVTKSDAPPTAVAAPAADKSKTEKKTEVADTPTSNKTSITKEELKQKRTGTIEKKKELVTKSKSTKRAKNAVLGKKPGQD